MAQKSRSKLITLKCLMTLKHNFEKEFKNKNKKEAEISQLGISGDFYNNNKCRVI